LQQERLRVQQQTTLKITKAYSIQHTTSSERRNSTVLHLVQPQTQPFKCPRGCRTAVQ